MKPDEYFPRRDCPRFHRCCANICPGDPKWRVRSHVRGEQVCKYLLDMSKQGGLGVCTDVLPSELLELVVSQRGDILARHRAIGKRCEEAVNDGIRGKPQGRKQK